MHVPYTWLFVPKILLTYSGTTKTPLWRPVLYAFSSAIVVFQLLSLFHHYSTQAKLFLRLTRPSLIAKVASFKSSQCEDCSILFSGHALICIVYGVTSV